MPARPALALALARALALAAALACAAPAHAQGIGGGAAATRADRYVLDATAAPYLAKGDGAADDTAAIQAAVHAAQRLAWTPSASNPAPGQQPPTPTVYLPGGVYRITRPICLAGRNVALELATGAQLVNTTTPRPLVDIGGFGSQGVVVEAGPSWEPGLYATGRQNRPDARAAAALDGVSGLDSTIAPAAGSWHGWRPRAPDRDALYRVEPTSFTADPPGGATYTLAFKPGPSATPETTAALAWDASPAAVQAALEALPSIAPGDVACTATAARRAGFRNAGPGRVDIRFTGQFANAPLAADVGASVALSAGSYTGEGWSPSVSRRLAGGSQWAQWVIPACGANGGGRRPGYNIRDAESVTFDVAFRYPINNHVSPSTNSPVVSQQIAGVGSVSNGVQPWAIYTNTHNSLWISFSLNDDDPMQGAVKKRAIRVNLPGGQTFTGCVRASFQFDFRPDTVATADWAQILTVWLGNGNAAPTKATWQWNPGSVTTIPATPRFADLGLIDPVILGSYGGGHLPEYPDGYEVLGLSVYAGRKYDPSQSAQTKAAGGAADDAYRYTPVGGNPANTAALLHLDGTDVARYDADEATYGPGGYDPRYAVAWEAGYQAGAQFYQVNRSGTNGVEQMLTTSNIAVRGDGDQVNQGPVLRGGSAAVQVTHLVHGSVSNLTLGRDAHLGIYRMPGSIGNYVIDLHRLTFAAGAAAVRMSATARLSIRDVAVLDGSIQAPFIFSNCAATIRGFYLHDLAARRAVTAVNAVGCGLDVADGVISTEHTGLSDCWFYFRRSTADECYFRVANVTGNPKGTRTVARLDDAQAGAPEAPCVVQIDVSPQFLDYGDGSVPTFVTNGPMMVGQVRVPVSAEGGAVMPSLLHTAAHGAVCNVRLLPWSAGPTPVGEIDPVGSLPATP